METSMDLTTWTPLVSGQLPDPTGQQLICWANNNTPVSHPFSTTQPEGTVAKYLKVTMVDAWGDYGGGLQALEVEPRQILEALFVPDI